jgi:hypothetical protein
VETEKDPITKVTFEKSDFKFLAAYEAYSKAFDDSSEEDVRQKLNELVTQLSADEISYPRFYSQIGEFREESDGREFRRTRIQGSRKFAYRRKEQERDRIKRHKR